MTSQLAEYGDAALVNTLTGNAVPVAADSGSPPTWIPGLYWYDTTDSDFQQWDGSSWTASPAPGTRYLALLTADPVQAGAVNVSDLTEMTTDGYARQSITFGDASLAYPSLASNTNLITFGAFSASMLAPIQWAAMVTSASGTSGYFLASWQLVAPVQVDASQYIQVGVGQLVVQGQ